MAQTDIQKARIQEILSELAQTNHLRQIYETPDPYRDQIVEYCEKKIAKYQATIDFNVNLAIEAPAKLPGILEKIEKLNSELTKIRENTKVSVRKSFTERMTEKVNQRVLENPELAEKQAEFLKILALIED